MLISLFKRISGPEDSEEKPSVNQNKVFVRSLIPILLLSNSISFHPIALYRSTNLLCLFNPYGVQSFLKSERMAHRSLRLDSRQSIAVEITLNQQETNLNLILCQFSASTFGPQNFSQAVARVCYIQRSSATCYFQISVLNSECVPWKVLHLSFGWFAAVLVRGEMRSLSCTSSLPI